MLDIADHLGLDTFGVVGRSGGGPHALACAAFIGGNRLRSVAVLVGLAPSDAIGLNWFEGMTESNVQDYELAELDGDDAVVAVLSGQANKLGGPKSLLNALHKEWPELTVEGSTSSAATGPRATGSDQERAVRGRRLPRFGGQGFRAEQDQDPVRLWHGDQDVFSPLAHSRWMADRIPSAQIEVEPGAAHFGAIEMLPKVLAQLKEDSLRPRSAPVAS